MTTTDDLAALNWDAQMHHTGRVKPTVKKKYKKPEATIAAQCMDYLALLGIIAFRTNAGHWVTAEGYHIQGVPEGYADIHACAWGAFLAIETKAPKKGLKPAQETYRARVEAAGGTYIMASSVDALRAGLCGAYGPQRVASWEEAGRARVAAKKAAVRAVREKGR